MPTPRPAERRSRQPAVTGAGSSLDAHLLTEMVTKLRRALRASIRTDIPWEALPMAQVELLLTLEELAPARIGDLAERLHLAGSTVSGLIAQMIDSGLVQRQTDPADRRAAVVTLTPPGQAQQTDWETAHEQRIAAALGQLCSRDRDAILRALPALGQPDSPSERRHLEGSRAGARSAGEATPSRPARRPSSCERPGEEGVLAGEDGTHVADGHASADALPTTGGDEASSLAEMSPVTEMPTEGIVTAGNVPPPRLDWHSMTVPTPRAWARRSRSSTGAVAICHNGSVCPASRRK